MQPLFLTVYFDHDSFGKKAEETGQHLKSIQDWECLNFGSEREWSTVQQANQCSWSVEVMVHALSLAQMCISKVDDIPQDWDLLMLYILQ